MRKRGFSALATAALLATVLGTTGAANSHAADPSTKVHHVHGWSSHGRTDLTVTEHIEGNGKSWAEVGDAGVSSTTPAAARRQAKLAAADSDGEPQPIVTESDVEAWASDTTPVTDSDPGPQPDSDGVVTYADPDGSTGTQTAKAKGTAARASTGPQGLTPVEPGDPAARGCTNGCLPDFDCAYINASDNDVHAKMCAYYAYSHKSNGNTFFTTRGVGTAWSTDTHCTNCDKIWKFASWNDMSNNNGTVIDWAPESSGPVGKCANKTATTSATVGGTTFSSSETKEVCPDTWGVYSDAITKSSSGSRWAGDATEDARGTHYVQLNAWDRSGGTLYLAAHGRVWW